MKLVKYDHSPFRALDDVHKEINDLFGLSLWKDLFREREALLPTVDIYEDKDNIYVDADIPGFEQKDISVKVNGSMLTLSAERNEDKERKKKGHYCCERYHGSFRRVMELPQTVDQSKIAAKYKKGVLKITLPKKEEEKNKEITVKVE